jgi:CubicO group peptidase (beta-lactamase class C family)
VYERYHPLDGRDKVYDSWSVAKSFTSALIGLLVQDGLLGLDEHPVRAEWSTPGDPRQAITVRHLLQMTSGLAWIDDGFQPGTYGARLLSAQNAAHLVASEPLWAEPGTVFNYSTGTSALLFGIAADLLGGCEAATDYLNARLLDPIGITTDQLVTDGDGCWLGGLGANMTTRDFARFGLLFLRGGVWDGTALLPSTWVDESRAPVAINPEYGLHWWLSVDGSRFMAEGLFGQRIVLLPDQDLMVVTNSTEGGDAFTLVDSVISAFSDAPQS